MKILVINGPNLNLLGVREKSIYGNTSLKEINQELTKTATAHPSKTELMFFQSNNEGLIVDRIHQAFDENTDGILINPAAFGHTSIAIRDAFLATSIPFVEVHLSNVHAREEFRKQTYLSDIACGVVIGFSTKSYELGLIGLIDKLKDIQGK